MELSDLDYSKIPVMYRNNNTKPAFIPVLSDSEGFCSLCDTNPAEKEIFYERVSFGVVKRFREQVCQQCLDDEPDYFIGKNIIKIVKL